MHLAIAIAALIGLRSLLNIAADIQHRASMGRDFPAVYIMARTVRDGLDTNRMLGDLGTRYGFPPGLGSYNHPSPHPPTMGLMLAPLGFFDYWTAGNIWLVVHLVLITLSIALLLAYFGIRLHPAVLALSPFVALNWPHLWLEVWNGQVHIAITAALCGMLLALRRNRPILAGILLAVALLIKPIAWPVILVLAWHLRWRTVLASVVFGAVAFGAVAVLSGPLSLWTYLTISLPTTMHLFRAFWANGSVASIGWRLFEGADVPLLSGTHIQIVPVAEAPLLARMLAVIIPASVFALSFVLIRRRSLEVGIAVALVVGIATAPVTWAHYFVLLLVPLALLAEQLAHLGWPPGPTNAAIILLLPLLVPQIALMAAALAMSGNAPSDPVMMLPALLSLIVVVPTLAALGLAYLLCRISPAR